MRTQMIRSYSTISLSSYNNSPRPSLRRDGSLGGDEESANNSLEEVIRNANARPRKSEQLKYISQNFIGNCFRRKTAERSFPIIQWLPEYNVQKLIADIVAAITVTITMLPQGMAYASIANLPPEYGLYSCFAGCFVHLFFGSCPQVTIGPTAILAILSYTYTKGLPQHTVVMLTFLTGVTSFLLGILKLGFVVNFISRPVSAAFTTAASLTICSTQFKEALGLEFSSQGFIATLMATVEHVGETRMADCILSVGSIIVLVVLRMLPDILGCIGIKDNAIVKFISISRNALVVLITTAVVTIMASTQPFTVVKEIKSGLPPFDFPPFSITNTTSNITYTFTEHILENAGSAIIVMPLLALMEHISVAKALAGDKMVDASQELVSTGLSNLVGCFFSSIPITGSFSLTTVNYASGAKSPMAGAFTGIMVLLAISFMTPYFYYIPKSSLAAVIICAVIFMIDFGIIRSMWNSKKMELIPWGLTIAVSLVLGLQFGMMTGFLISVFYLLYYAARPGVKVKKGFTTNSTEFILIQLDRSLTFPSVEYIRYIVTKASNSGKNKLPLVIDCHHIQFADFTAAQGLTQIITIFKKRDQLILLWNAKDSIVRILEGVDPEYHVVLTESELEAILDAQAQSEQTGMPKILVDRVDSVKSESPSQKLEDEITNQNDYVIQNDLNNSRTVT